ncbi:DNA replication/repair protein RecF [Gynuella sunshinyii]|uniref:DNA replication and repair protein RecF n=1 Tax=Gynuella sunshinyii YC6258 TaxID=1445510 RepID=A0A0C5VEL7_9GAMM|nr:DNA replication/repair protein RecF [Gynuella sunshinyii]AJQ92646.1 recombinational DNA repair ATPase (RecF pathway) [Gynuella sunshinyii YC6258]
MTIHRLHIQGVRNISDARLEPAYFVNIVFGDNGSGKTSVLESIHILTHGRSFRSTSSKNTTLIQQGLHALTVYGEIGEIHNHVGVSKAVDGVNQIKISGEKVTAVSELAKLSPVQIIDAQAFDLLTGSPAVRRQFLDWGVFHVEHGFLNVWQRVQKALKNRNSLLRSGKITDPIQMSAWTREFASAAERLDEYRQQYLERFKQQFVDILAKLTDLDDFSLSYHRGWDKARSLLDVLGASEDVDIKTGFTHSGPQRADIRIKLGKHNAADILSRGQQKLVVIAMKLAQGAHLQTFKEHKRCIFLLDDLPAELDSNHTHKVCQILEQMDAQVFLTCVEPGELLEFWNNKDQIKMFHVKHGQVSGELDE